MRAIVEGDLFLSARSSFFLSFFFSHPDSCLKIKIFVVKTMFLGRPGGHQGGTGEEKTEKKNEKMKQKNEK